MRVRVCVYIIVVEKKLLENIKYINKTMLLKTNGSGKVIKNL